MKATDDIKNVINQYATADNLITRINIHVDVTADSVLVTSDNKQNLAVGF